jgi:serine phosphatase RsbU (regulator of sigma subunit)
MVSRPQPASTDFGGVHSSGYTDGITEAVNDRGEEFGEEGLVEALRRHRDQPCQAAVESIANEVCALSPGNQQDDITLILARCRAS